MAKHRKTQAVIHAEYTKVLDMLNAGITDLEIRAALGLSQAQVRAYLSKAFLDGHSIKSVGYIPVMASSMPEAVRSFFAAGKGDIFKIEPPDGNESSRISLIRGQAGTTNVTAEAGI